MKPDLQIAYDIMMRAREDGAGPDLSEHVQAVVWGWHDADRDYWLKNRNGSVNILAEELSKLTGHPLPECLEVVKSAHGDSERDIRIRAIFEFAKMLPSEPPGNSSVPDAIKRARGQR